MDERIRPAAAADIGAIEAAVHAAYSVYVPRIGREPAPMSDDYASLVADGRVHVLEVAGEIRGILVLLPREGSVLLDNVAVPPEFQGRGYGRRLIMFAERAASAAGSKRLVLYTNEPMSENLALYVRLGFGETHRAVEDGLRRVYMAKPLPDDGKGFKEGDTGPAGRVLRVADMTHRPWGEGCLSWDMVDGGDMLVVSERMPPGTGEVRHLHLRARQAFLVLRGELVIEAGGSEFAVGPGEAFEVAPGTPHQVFNRSGDAVEFLAISAPSTKGDRHVAGDSRGAR